MIDLTPFVSTDLNRPYLGQPWSVGDFTYASNGHVMVRVDRRPGVGKIERAPDGQRLLDKHDFSNLAAVEIIPLPEQVTHTCHDCDGRGTEHDCEHCQCQCEGCLGTGIRGPFRTQSIIIAGSIFDLEYIRRLFVLPGLKLGRIYQEDKPMPFSFDGGIGVLMGMKGKRTWSEHYDYTELLAKHRVLV